MFPADTNTLHDTLSLLETETKSESEFSRDVTAGVEMCDETAGVDACDKNASEDELGRFGGDLVAAKRVCQSSKWCKRKYQLDYNFLCKIWQMWTRTILPVVT